MLAVADLSAAETVAAIVVNVAMANRSENVRERITAGQQGPAIFVDAHNSRVVCGLPMSEIPETMQLQSKFELVRLLHRSHADGTPIVLGGSVTVKHHPEIVGQILYGFLHPRLAVQHRQ